MLGRLRSIPAEPHCSQPHVHHDISLVFICQLYIHIHQFNIYRIPSSVDI